LAAANLRLQAAADRREQHDTVSFPDAAADGLKRTAHCALPVQVLCNYH